MSKPAQAITWQQLKDAINDLPEQFLENHVLVWGEDRGFRIQAVHVINEEMRQTDESVEPTSILVDNLSEGETIDDYPVAFIAGEIVLCTDMYE